MFPGMDTAPAVVGSWVGWLALAAFIFAYVLVVMEERLQLRKSVPVLVAAGVIWIGIGAAYAVNGDTETVAEALRHYLLEYVELFLFLLSAMTYVNCMEERGVFDLLRQKLMELRMSLRQLFWVTGALAFCISPVADNLTTALIMGAVVMAVAAGNPKFTAAACVNVVVAANAGGAFSPFGDITTLMVWQSGIVSFWTFFSLLLPSLVNWLVPAAIMATVIPRERELAQAEVLPATVHRGADRVTLLFLATIASTVILRQTLNIPPAVSMMAGLGALKLYSWLLRRSERRHAQEHVLVEFESPQDSFDIFRQMERLEWDTLMFFYGIMLCVGSLNTLGYLALASTALYGGIGPTLTNVTLGLASAILDNIPLMFAVLSMRPDMSTNQWLLITLTAGVGGSLLSIGSAAGVALMGLAPGVYTFRSHLRWAWAVLLGYAASIGVHLALNGW